LYHTIHALRRNEVHFLAQFAVLASTGKRVALQRLLRARARLRPSREKIVETLLEVHLFAGFPAAIEGFFTLNSVFEPHTEIKKKPMSLRDRTRRGEKVCKKVYGEKYSGLRSAMDQLHPEFSDWIIQDGYGKVLSRPGLSLKERELIAIAVLAALGWRRQLNSHIAGSLNAGASIGELEAVCKAILPYIRASHAAELRRQIARASRTFIPAKKV
jgi:4-carboxymuconolactone decarboxylase